jgi:hypothetical protein
MKRMAVREKEGWKKHEGGENEGGENEGGENEGGENEGGENEGGENEGMIYKGVERDGWRDPFLTCVLESCLAASERVMISFIVAAGARRPAENGRGRGLEIARVCTRNPGGWLVSSGLFGSHAV